MFGKANEIKTMEMWHHFLENWLKKHPKITIIDIKYALGKEDKSSVLIIYKEHAEFTNPFEEES